MSSDQACGCAPHRQGDAVGHCRVEPTAVATEARQVDLARPGRTAPRRDGMDVLRRRRGARGRRGGVRPHCGHNAKFSEGELHGHMVCVPESGCASL
eukprot:6101405-Prymnesium_polylepis.1